MEWGSWTLSCEFAFYLLAPFIFRAILKAKLPANKLFYRLVDIWIALLVVSSYDNYKYWDNLLDFGYYFPLPCFLEFLFGATGALLLQTKWNFKSQISSIIIMLVPLALYLFVTQQAVTVVIKS